MRKLLIYLSLVCASHLQAQTNDTINMMQIQPLKDQITGLQQQIDDINSRQEKFANMTSFAGLIYLGAIAVVGINAGSDEPKDNLYYVAGGMVLTSSVMLYFSANRLRIKVH